VGGEVVMAAGAAMGGGAGIMAGGAGGIVGSAGVVTIAKKQALLVLMRQAFTPHRAPYSPSENPQRQICANGRFRARGVRDFSESPLRQISTFIFRIETRPPTTRVLAKLHFEQR